MYAMKLLTSADAKAVGELVDLRMDRQLYRGHAINGEAADLLDLVAHGEADCSLLPLGMWDDGTLAGAFVVERAAPRDGWSAEQGEEPSLLVSLAHAHPGHPHLARAVTPWLKDLAARLPDPPTAVRCTVYAADLAWYLIRTCRWQLVREIRERQRRVHLLQHTSQRIENVHALIRTSPELTACATGGGIPVLPPSGGPS